MLETDPCQGPLQPLNSTGGRSSPPDGCVYALVDMARSTARLEILLSSQWRIKVGFSPPWLSDSSAVLQAVSTSLASPGPPHWEQSHRITECSRLDRTSGGLLNHLPSFGASHLALLCFTWASEQQGYICTNSIACTLFCSHAHTQC